MVDKFFLFFFILIGGAFFAQSKQELDKVMLSKDPYEISNFIKKYPQDPNTSFLRKKINNLKEEKNLAQVSSQANLKSTTVGVSKNKTELSPKAKKTEDVLNHLFSNDPSSTEAYLQIKNLSNCDIKVKLEGKKTFYVDVPKMGENYILLPKGYYNISTDICSAQFSSAKNINQDMQINLMGPKKARN
jgi:DNA-binding phage protein